jgi:hypothetical protein
MGFFISPGVELLPLVDVVRVSEEEGKMRERL